MATLGQMVRLGPPVLLEDRQGQRALHLLFLVLLVLLDRWV